MKLSAKADYAVRAVLVLASHDEPHPLKGELIAQSQELPLKFVENILGELKHAGLVVSQRGPEGGYRLAVPADQITVAEVIRVVDGPLAAVAGTRPEAIKLSARRGGAAGRLAGGSLSSCGRCSRTSPSPISSGAPASAPPGRGVGRRRGRWRISRRT